MHPTLYLLNGEKIIGSQSILSAENNNVLLGNCVSQEGIIKQGKWLFWDEVYFNLMASMRKMRMPIPMEFTLDYFKNLVNPELSPILHYTYRIDILHIDGRIEHLIEINQNETKNSDLYLSYEIDVFNDLHIEPNYLSAIPNAKAENIVAKQFAKDNQIDDVLFLNTSLKVARSIFGNVYFIENNTLYTNDITTGAFKQAIDQAFQSIFEVEIRTFSAFELQKADELFVLSEKKGITPVSKFRKKSYANEKVMQMQKELIH